MKLHNVKRQTAPHKARVGEGWTALEVFDGGHAIELEPGEYLAGASGSAWFRIVPVIHVRAVLDGDIRSEMGLRTSIVNDIEPGIDAARRVAVLAEERVPADSPAVRRSFSVSGIVSVPEGPPARLSLFASLLRSVEVGGLPVELRGLQLWTVKLQGGDA